MSNPKIELWLLLHFADWSPGMAIVPALAKIMPDYDKHLTEHIITHAAVGHAMARGKALTPDGKPPRNMPGTNLWVLVNRIAGA